MTPSGHQARPGKGGLLVVAGEASGDLHGARLLQELRRLVPEVHAFGLGGDELDASGLDLLAHASEISVVGIIEALRVLPRARRIFHRLLEEVDRRRPDAALLIDSPDFNLRLARRLRRRDVEVLYYVSPQVWAWRRGRVKTISRLVDCMMVLFPFEVDFYRKHGIEVHHVGHPLVDEVPQLPHVWDDGPPREGPYRIAVLPGSRVSEVEALLPTLLESVKVLARKLPVQVQLVQAPTVQARLLEEAVGLADLPAEIVSRERFQAVASSHLALCASGTATLEVGLLGTPMIVVYRLASRWTTLVARLVIRLPSISLVNLILGRRAVPELLQERARPDLIAKEAAALLKDEARVDQMRRDLAGLREKLGNPGASRRAAELVATRLMARSSR